MYTAKIRFLITGTGRCGTVAFAKLLTDAGYPCGHERIFTHQGLAKAKEVMQSGGGNSHASTRSGLNSNGTTHHLLAESSYLAVPFLGEPFLENTKIIHLVRHPVNVICSFINKLHYFKDDKSPYEEFINRHCPSVWKEPTPFLRACRYWIDWNKMITGFVHRVEDDPTKALEFLGIKTNVQIDALCNSAWDKPIIHQATREEVITHPEVMELARHYGY